MRERRRKGETETERGWQTKEAAANTPPAQSIFLICKMGTKNTSPSLGHSRECKEGNEGTLLTHKLPPAPFLTLVSLLTKHTLKVRPVLIKRFQPHSKCDERGAEKEGFRWASR